jgi:hypothetical protein
MKKTKCDGEFPCKRCKDDGLVCTAGVRKKTEYKQLPRGYAEVLENTQFALIATVHKLYAMVRSGQQWDLGEPELNDRGQPVIHNIAHKLGCIRPNSDIDLPVHSIFPEDEAGMAELARQLEEQQTDSVDVEAPQKGHKGDRSRSMEGEFEDSNSGRTDRASSSDLDHSDFEQDLYDYRRAAFGSSNNPMTMSPQSYASSYDFESSPGDVDPSAMFGPSPTTAAAPVPVFSQNWAAAAIRQQHQQQSSSLRMAQQYLQSSGLSNVDMLNQGLLESNFGQLKPHFPNNPEVMLGMGDPMIYSGYEGEPMRL